MQANEASRTHAPLLRQPAPGYILLLLALGALAEWLRHPGSWTGWWLEDLPVYSRALHEWLAGQNPYTSVSKPLYFLYPPIFLYVGGFFARVLPAYWGTALYLCLHFSAVIALPLILARYFFRQAWLGPLFALLVFFISPNFVGVDALFSCNIGSLLYCVAFLGAVPGLRENRWRWFYLAVAAAALVKITFLVLLLLLPLAAGRRTWQKCAITTILVGAAQLVQRGLWPGLYGGYQWSLEQCILSEGHFGSGAFNILARYSRQQGWGLGPMPYIGTALFSTAIAVSLWLLHRRLRAAGCSSTNPYWLALVITGMILINPRPMQYDLDIAQFSGFVLWVYALRVRRLLVLVAALSLSSLAVLQAISNPHISVAYPTLVALAAFTAGYWRLWRESSGRLSERREDTDMPLRSATAG